LIDWQEVEILDVVLGNQCIVVAEEPLLSEDLRLMQVEVGFEVGNVIF
jgi:hypothetical protein